MCFPRALPLSPQPVTCAESDQALVDTVRASCLLWPRS